MISDEISEEILRFWFEDVESSCWFKKVRNSIVNERDDSL